MRNRPEYKFFKNWSYALAGWREIYANERSFRLEIFIFAPAAASLIFWNFGATLNLFIIFSMALVLILECVNSAIERVVDLASPGIHALAGAAKDAGRTSVMIGNFLAGGVWAWAIFSKILA